MHLWCNVKGTSAPRNHLYMLMSELEAAFHKPRFGILWSEFNLEEKVACFDSVDWAASYPLDPPPRYLMFEQGKDNWSNWA